MSNQPQKMDSTESSELNIKIDPHRSRQSSGITKNFRPVTILSKMLQTFLSIVILGTCITEFFANNIKSPKHPGDNWFMATCSDMLDGSPDSQDTSFFSLYCGKEYTNGSNQVSVNPFYWMVANSGVYTKKYLFKIHTIQF